MISIVITSFKEPDSIGKAIESIINQNIKENYELIVSAPDMETLAVAGKYKKINSKIKLFKDPGKGKSYALNLIFKKLSGEIIILTDGDVYVSENAINEILKKFENQNIGCVSGRPVPQENKNSQYGYWANFLFDAAHGLRKKLYVNGKFLECSGYLWAFRNNVIKNIPLDVAEDSVMPYLFFEKGYKIGYAENAKVYVKNADNWNDWIKQKVRTSKAHETLKKYVNLNIAPRTKTFSNETKGIFYLFSYPKNLKEFYWTLKLIVARFYMWIKVFYDTKFKNRHYNDAWDRVESTK
jgi:cellulose synthase/poly-beta-1,6-N-acetylglucosamine synthase-like glycosyltransferase